MIPLPLHGLQGAHQIKPLVLGLCHVLLLAFRLQTYGRHLGECARNATIIIFFSPSFATMSLPFFPGSILLLEIVPPVGEQYSSFLVPLAKAHSLDGYPLPGVFRKQIPSFFLRPTPLKKEDQTPSPPTGASLPSFLEETASPTT